MYASQVCLMGSFLFPSFSFTRAKLRGDPAFRLLGFSTTVKTARTPNLKKRAQRSSQGGVSSNSTVIFKVKPLVKTLLRHGIFCLTLCLRFSFFFHWELAFVTQHSSAAVFPPLFHNNKNCRFAPSQETSTGAPLKCGRLSPLVLFQVSEWVPAPKGKRAPTPKQAVIRRSLFDRCPFCFDVPRHWLPASEASCPRASWWYAS